MTMAIIAARPASSDHPDAPDIPPTPADHVHCRATRKAMLRLIPVLAIIYFMSYVDRTNIAMAKTQLQADVGISVAAFGLGAGLFFIAYACLQVPANLIMYRLGARRWITVIALLWRSVTVGMMFVSSEVMFYGLRIALGAFEAGLYPAILFMVTRWFAQKDRATAIGYVQAASCLGVILGAPLGGFLMGFHGVAGLHGWQWMFLIEGVATVLIGLTLIRLLSDRPREARWFGPQEAAALEDASGAGDAGNETSSLKGNLWAAFGRPFILIIGAIYFLNQIVINGLSFNVPAIIEGMDVSSTFVIGILSGVTAVGGLVGVLVTPRIARRMGNETVLLGALAPGRRPDPGLHRLRRPRLRRPVLRTAAGLHGGHRRPGDRLHADLLVDRHAPDDRRHRRGRPGLHQHHRTARRLLRSLCLRCGRVEDRRPDVRAVGHRRGRCHRWSPRGSAEPRAAQGGPERGGGVAGRLTHTGGRREDADRARSASSLCCAFREMQVTVDGELLFSERLDRKRCTSHNTEQYGRS
ncbi:MFS transporter [Corynebacterium variabile]|uniref:MFS transporter n=1 Tax=Corynebacterium variabile TaxID=1727 RepID=UPI0028AA2067|nr:MFS transporter [Corynebacterium variabile]